MSLKRGYKLFPDEFYTPHIGISPYKLDRQEPSPSQTEIELTGIGALRRLGENLVTTVSGKAALDFFLSALRLSSTSVVGIFTTSGNTYVSRCVTETINQHCGWVVNSSQDCAAIVIIHEFGYLVSEKRMLEFRNLGIPIINDFAYSFLGLHRSSRYDFSAEMNFTSLPKAFDINYGGIMSVPQGITSTPTNSFDFWPHGLLDAFSTDGLKKNAESRISNFQYYLDALSHWGVSAYWDDTYQGVPSVAMLEIDFAIDLTLLRYFLNRHGIESSVFFGRQAFFVPVHQALSASELDYVVAMIKSGLEYASR